MRTHAMRPFGGSSSDLEIAGAGSAEWTTPALRCAAAELHLRGSTAAAGVAR